MGGGKGNCNLHHVFVCTGLQLYLPEEDLPFSHENMICDVISRKESVTHTHVFFVAMEVRHVYFVSQWQKIDQFPVCCTSRVISSKATKKELIFVLLTKRARCSFCLLLVRVCLTLFQHKPHKVTRNSELYENVSEVRFEFALMNSFHGNQVTQLLFN